MSCPLIPEPSDLPDEETRSFETGPEVDGCEAVGLTCVPLEYFVLDGTLEIC